MARLKLTSRSVSQQVWQHWRPRPKVNSWEWIQEHVRSPKGETFDGGDYPWARGVCEAFDNPQVREIDLMWGTRLGKTFIGQALSFCLMATNPMPGIFASSVQKLARDNVLTKIYPMLERCVPLRDQLKSPARRSMFRIDLRDSIWKVGWSGSDSSLADFGAYMIHCSEVDKWTDDESTEADPVELIAERCREFPDYKAVFESTPGREETSRIAPKVAASNNCHFYVPCPRCHHHQLLRFAVDVDGKYDLSQGGVVWDGLDQNRFDPDLALETSRYVCAGCKGELHDEHRRE